MNLAYPETNRSLRRMESCWKEDLEEFFRAVRSHVTSFNMSVLSQATGEGKSGPVETGLTGPAARGSVGHPI